MGISWAVCGHIRRESQATYLADRLYARMSMDTGDLGSLENHDRAWRTAYDDGNPWVGVVEDDAVLIPAFHETVETALDHVPGDGAVSLYVGTGKPLQPLVRRAIHRAKRQGSNWLVKNTALWGPALLLPREHVMPMLKYVSGIDMPYDQRLSQYLKSVDLPCYYAWPSLVDHRDDESLIRQPGVRRKAHKTGPPTGDWASPPVKIDRK